MHSIKMPVFREDLDQVVNFDGTTMLEVTTEDKTCYGTG